MRLLVVGGGVAGAATAIAAKQLGMDAVVLERRPSLDRDEGSWITVAPNGLDALEALGVLDRVRVIGHASVLNRMYGATGRHLGDVSIGTPLPDGTVALTMKRSALAGVLTDAAGERGAEVHHGAQVLSVGDDGAGVRAELSDGSVVRGDVLVGADGVRSHVRRSIDPSAPEARYVGLTNFGGITRDVHQLADELTPQAWHFVFGRRSFFGAHPLPSGDIAWFVNVPRAQMGPDERADTTEHQWLTWLGELVGNDAGPAAALIASGRLELAGDNIFDLAHVPSWWRGHMVLVGDAAHAPSPSSGQGAALALEDAVVLSRSLAEHGSDGLARYEHARRRRVEAIVKAGARSSSAKIPGRVGRVPMETMLSLVFRTGLAARATAGFTAHRVGRG